MSDFLIYGDSLRCAEMRHEVPIPIVDPFLFLEIGGQRHVVASSLEIARLNLLEVIAHPFEDFGLDRRLAARASRSEALRGVAVEAVLALGLQDGLISEVFPFWLGESLRSEGIDLMVDADFFAGRRRAKTPDELAGIRRAQRAGDLAMETVREILRSSRIVDSRLELTGEPLTAERVRAAIRRALVDQTVAVDDFVVASGPQAASVHSIGTGALAPHVPIVVDIWPRDLVSGCYCDMSRTFVVGSPSPEIALWHELCLEALYRVLSLARAGASARGLYDASCDVFEHAGQPTQRTKEVGETLESGFLHGLGHGVGLEGHEGPFIGLSSHGELLAGDVVAIEPGCYDPRIGGVRIEDLVLIEPHGMTKLSRSPHDLYP